MLRKLFAPSGFKIALLITVLISLTYLVNTLDPSGSYLNLMDKKWVDFIVKRRDVQPHTSAVAIATIDTKSVDKYGRWPWPRERMAQLTRALNEYYDVGTIGFDIVFSEPEHDTGIAVTEQYKDLFASLGLQRAPQGQRFLQEMEETKHRLNGDQRFANAVAEEDNAILGYFFFNNEENVRHLTPEERMASAERISGSEISLLKGSFTRGMIPLGRAVESNIGPISKAGYLSGFFNVNPDIEDGTVRRVHLLTQYGENVYPSLDLQILKHYYGADNILVEAEENAGILAIEVGSLVIEPNFDSSVLLNYKGPAETFPHFSIYDIIEHNVPKEALQDKIVLVGATEIGIYDLRTTPVGVAYPGVEIHATLLDNILTGDYFHLHLVNDLMSVGLILLLGIVLGIALPNLRSIYGTVVALVLILGYTAGHRYMVNELHSWTSYIYVVMVIVAVWGAVTLFRFLVTDKDKRFIRNAFQQYLSPDVITQLMDNPGMLKLGGERRVMTAFFSDVQGFSTISEQLEPEELVALLNAYLTEMTDIVTNHQGTIDKYEGDAIIAFFGAPIDYEDHAARACLVSLEMQRRLAEMRAGWAEEGKPQLKMRIGLNTGPMVVGNMGSEKRFDYTMMGNAVNLAARLEGANKNYGSYTCISEYTYEMAKDAIETRELDLIRVMGIHTPVRIYELVAPKGELSEEQRKGFAYFAKGLELYRAKQFEEAIKYFNAVNKFIPDDPPSATFIERCQAFLQNPPPEEWDGVFTAASK